MALKNRFKLRMGNDISNALDYLAVKLGTNQADVLRKALSLYIEVKKEEGNQVILKNDKLKKLTTIANI